MQWGFFTAGFSLGSFIATSCMVALHDRILAATNFESPGLTTYYHRLAHRIGDEAYWRSRCVNYLTIPNPINMCQPHLGRIIRVTLKVECRTGEFF